MLNVVNQKGVIKDKATLIDIDTAADQLPEGLVIIPLALWESHKAVLQERGNLGIWLNSDEHPSLIADDIKQFSVIAINFPAFTDGRGYSYARELRTVYNYEGDIRAIGDVLLDQLFYMKRCGFSSFALKNEARTEEAKKYFAEFDEPYQAAWDNDQPLFRRKARG